MSAGYTIILPQFEGPFDLLLFFIERDELDIQDIPIAKITEDFLDYLHSMERMNIDLAGEFILVAATLCRIKARMMLPRKQLDEQGNEIDPRQELVDRLLEYKRYKSVLDEMRALEEDRAQKTTRGNVSDELQKIATRALVDSELESLTLFRLLKAFERVMQRMENMQPRPMHQIARFSYTVEEQQIFILSRIPQGGRADFNTIFSDCANRIHAIVTFLAMLELLNMQRITILAAMGANSFWLEAVEE
ncbi:MAG: segregation/condensation protein A [Saprospiraceae bacterium]|nr:segregation/condensation protein A [Saprospiraceae bacterium]